MGTSRTLRGSLYRPVMWNKLGAFVVSRGSALTRPHVRIARMSASGTSADHRSNSGIGPDIVIAGAARSGTSFLSATLSRHSRVDAGAVKEPNYFSSRWSEGVEWYDAQFAPRKPGLLRLDSSVSYTYPQHPNALSRLRDASPDVKIIYAVRSPTPRLVSMYQLFRFYASPDMFANLGEAIDKSEMCLLSGDYDLWLDRFRSLFPLEQILIVPFPLITKDVNAVLDVLLPWLGLSPEAQLIRPETNRYRNEVRQARWSTLSKVQRRLYKSKTYPFIRSAIGPDRLRKLSRFATRATAIPNVEDEVGTLTPVQRDRVDEVSRRAITAVDHWLQQQDTRYGSSWAREWTDHVQLPVS